MVKEQKWPYRGCLLSRAILSRAVLSRAASHLDSTLWEARFSQGTKQGMRQRYAFQDFAGQENIFNAIALSRITTSKQTYRLNIRLGLAFH